MRAAPAQESQVIRLEAQIEDLRAALEAIRGGGVDAVMLGGPNDERLYTLTSADRPYRVLVDEMGEGAATISERGVVLYANRRLCQLLGRQSGTTVGIDAVSLVAPSCHQALHDLLATAAGETGRAELELIGSDGRGVPALASATGLDIEGVLVHCLIVSDLTAVRHTQQLLADEQAKVALRTQEVESANRRLVRSNGELQEFAYVTSHDLSEPLRSIAGFAGLLERRYKGRLDPEADTFIEFITDGVARMQQLIDALLEYSRVDTRAGAFVPVDTAELVAISLKDLSAKVAESGAEIMVGPLPTVSADATQLGQVLANLLRNAMTFVRPDVVPEVHVTAVRDGNAWRFTVADNGIGIEPAHRERVFGMFKRLHSRDEYPGTGIGLAVVWKVVQRHGGRIWIEGDPGAGSSFHFTIPDNAGGPDFPSAEALPVSN